MNSINRMIARSARQWRLPPSVAAWIFWMPPAGAVAMVLARFDKRLFRFLLREDGPVEWGQAACFLVACLAAAGVAKCRLRAGYTGQAALFAALALAMFFVTGEELSWGQRLLGLETPGYLSAVNKQNEITLHNIGSASTGFKIIMLAGSMLALSAYAINKRFRLERYCDRADHLLVPPFFLASSFLVVFLYQGTRHTVWPTPGFTVTRYGEWSEFCLAFGAAVFLALNYWRLLSDNAEHRSASRAVRRRSASARCPQP